MILIILQLLNSEIWLNLLSLSSNESISPIISFLLNILFWSKIPLLSNISLISDKSVVYNLSFASVGFKNVNIIKCSSTTRFIF